MYNQQYEVCGDDAVLIWDGKEYSFKSYSMYAVVQYIDITTRVDAAAKRRSYCKATASIGLTLQCDTYPSEWIERRDIIATVKSSKGLEYQGSVHVALITRECDSIKLALYAVCGSKDKAHPNPTGLIADWYESLDETVTV